MVSFKDWIQQESFDDAGMWMGQAVNAFPIDDPQTKAKAAEFQKEFEKFNAFVKKYDYIGLARMFQVTAIGYPKIAFDFCSCLYSKIRGRDCDLKRASANVAKIIPASILMGTAKFAAPVALGMETGAAVAAGITAIQYLYWPFWGWASRNLDNPDQQKAKMAQIILAAIPDQFKQMLAVNNKTPEVKEWFESQMLLMSEHNPRFGELVS